MGFYNFKKIIRDKNLLFIGNPESSRAWSRWKIEWLLKELRNSGFDVEFYLQCDPDKIMNTAKELGDEKGAVIVGGGDGTLNCVINGLKDPSKAPILLIPWGTSNSIAKELGISEGLRSALNLIERGKIVKADMGLINNRRFLLCAGIGFDGEVLRIMKERGTFKGYQGYIIPFLETIIRYKEKKISVTVNEEHFQCGLVVVGNCSHYGWRFKVTHRGRLDSGMIDICMFEKGDSSAIINYAVLSLLGVPMKIKGMKYVNTKALQISSTERVPVQVDGDFFGYTPVKIMVVPGHIPLFSLNY